MKRNKNAFTLAEVLITLGIIGVVAALTVARLGSVKNRSYEAIRERTANQLEQGFVNMLHGVQNTGGELTMMLSALREQDIYPDNNTNNFLVTNNGNRLFETPSCRAALGIVPVDMTNNERKTYLNSFKQRVNNQNVSLTASYNRLNNRNTRVYKFKKTNAYIIVEPFLSSQNNFNSEDAVITRIYIAADGNNGDNLLSDPDHNVLGDIGVYGLGNNGNMYRDNSRECIAFDGGCRK